MGGAIRRKLLAQPEHVLASGEWFITVPEESTNLVVNPSGEVDTTNWAAVGTGVSISRDTTESYYGAASIKMTDTAATGGGEYIRTEGMTATAGTTYTLSFRYKKKATVAQTGFVGVFFYTAGAVFISSAAKALARGNVSTWTYETFTFVAPATTASVQLYFSTDGVTSGQYEIWLDGVQLEAKPYPTTYIDGSQDDCIWLGAANASASYRPATTRKGGRLQPMSNYKFRITAIIGAGAAALSTLATPYAQTGGGYYQGSVAPPRVITLVGGFECDSAIDLARRRSELLAAVTPLATPQGQPARLLYVPQSCGANIAEGVVIDGVYGGGLEGNLTNDFGQERASLTFTTYLPFAAIGSSQGDRANTATLNNALSSPLNIISRNKLTGAWSTLSGGAAGGGMQTALGPDGLPYFVGTFTTIGGVSANYVAKWTGSTFQALSTGPASAAGVQKIAVGPDGSVYYSAYISATIYRIYKWNGSAWSTLADCTHGANARIDALAVGPDGTLYVGGNFTAAGGTAANNIASYNGSAWSALGTGTNGNVFALATDKAGNLYAGGEFTTAGGTTVNYIAKWSASTWAAMGGGMTGSGTVGVYGLYIDRVGNLYAGGNFDTAGGVSAIDIAMWNGAGFSPLGGGLNIGTGVAKLILMFEDGSPGINVAGFFSVNSDTSIAWVARWTGSTWIPGPVYFAPASGNYLTTFVASGIYEFFGGQFSAATVPAVTSITVTTQTSDVKLTVTGPGKIVSLRNFTTGDEIFFNLTLNAGEVATLTTGQKFSFMSNYRGDISNAIASGSEIARFRLLPGANNVALFTTGTTGASAAALTYRETYASLDNIQ